MTKIKICGLKRIEDINCINKYLPEYIGFVFYRKSSRYISPENAAELKKMLNPAIKAVGVFVDEDKDSILKLCENNTIDIIQLHGSEDNDYINSLRACTKKPIIKAIRVQSTEQLEKAESIPCDYLLLDTYIKDMYGGSGRTFDRTLIPPEYREFFLAGGLNAQNISAAIKECRPYCVDLSSSVETGGFKDSGKIKEIINIVRATRMAEGEEP